ncbi:MAG TPA: branched-chain amino acid ABC transporter permease [Solirubrobacteraceae bacterium]
MHPALGAFAVAAVLPLLFPAGGAVLDNLVLAAAYVGMALGLNVIAGFAGLLDLGYVAFFAIGAYTAAAFGSDFWGVHLDSVAVLALAAATTALAGVLIGVPTLRLRGDYIAIVTLAFGEIVGTVVANGNQIHLFGGTLTAGPKGITPIDKLDLPLLEPFGAIDLRPWYWLALALMALALGVSVRLRDSRLGRAWTALREDEVTAASLGIPLVRTKLTAYATGAAFGGVSGAFLASYLNTVDPHQFQYSFSIFVFAMVVIGGLGSVWGVVLGALALSALNNWVLPDVLGGLPQKLGLDFDLAQVSSGVYGLLLVVLVLLRPQGLLPRRTRYVR